MRSPVFYFLIFVFLLSGCSDLPQSIPTATNTVQRSPVKLPPTWTLTASVSPSETPVRLPTMTFTPFPSVTPLPPTLTQGPTSDVRSPTSTHTMTPTVDNNCYLFALEAGVPILSAPFNNLYEVHSTMSATTTYQATRIYPPYYELVLDGGSNGWVDSRQLTLASKGPGCNQLPTDTRTLGDFSNLCTFIPKGEVEIYTDRAMLKPFQTITSTQSYVLLLKYTEVFLATADDLSPSFFIDPNQVNLSGDCDRVPTTGVTTTNGWLWSQPDGENGEQLATLTPGYRVFIQEGPVEGPGPPTTSEDGAWYYVLISPPEEGLSGWVWSSTIFLD